MDSHMTSGRPSLKGKTREPNPALTLRTVSQPTATVGATAWQAWGFHLQWVVMADSKASSWFVPH